MLSGYRIMWAMVMFDLPVLTKRERKAAAAFRNDLLDLGFEMAQYSVYLRFCPTQARIDALVSRIQICLPPTGKVSILVFTDKQYERTINFVGHQSVGKKQPPSQLEMF